MQFLHFFKQCRQMHLIHKASCITVSGEASFKTRETKSHITNIYLPARISVRDRLRSRGALASCPLLLLFISSWSTQTTCISHTINLLSLHKLCNLPTHHFWLHGDNQLQQNTKYRWLRRCLQPLRSGLLCWMCSSTQKSIQSDP